MTQAFGVDPMADAGRDVPLDRQFERGKALGRLKQRLRRYQLVAIAIAFNRMVATEALKATPLRQLVAATSVGIVENTVLLDLAYEEDSQAEVDMNLVMTEDGNFVEVQATAERHAFPRARLLEMMDYAETGIRQLHDLQREAIKAAGKE